ncbi:unnamed protein product, partial [Ixodes hexagonus]
MFSFFSVSSSGGKWRKRRKMLTPAFHFRVLESCMTIFNDQAKVLLRKLHESSDLGYVDIFPMMTHCSLDVLCEAAMGIKLQSQRTSEHHYVKNLHSILTVGMERLNKPWLWWDVAYNMSHQSRKFKGTALQINQFVREVIQERKKVLRCNEDKPDGPNCAKAFLDLLIKHHIEDGTFTEEDINEEVNTFLFAGHETTAIGMTYVLYLLGLYPDIQEKVVQELDSIFMGDTEREITREDISAMKYLECVIKESQRLYTIVPLYGRRIEEDMAIGKYTVPRGCTCIILSQMVHRDPRYFPNPTVFDPDRFLPENCKGRHPYAFIPFSAGPRNCVGKRSSEHYVSTTVTAPAEYTLICCRGVQFSASPNEGRRGQQTEYVSTRLRLGSNQREHESQPNSDAALLQKIVKKEHKQWPCIEAISDMKYLECVIK